MAQKQYAPATQRNRQPILDVLLKVLPKQGNILEIASGTGEHGVFFAPHFPNCQWIPSDINPQSRNSINAWRDDASLDNIQSPLDLNVQKSIWAIETLTPPLIINAIININMIHISPWEACIGLMAGAGRILPNRGILYLYGPFKVAGKHTSPSNQAFDESLQAQNPSWGVRNLDDVITTAKKQGLNFLQSISMPANNLSVVFERVND